MMKPKILEREYEEVQWQVYELKIILFYISVIHFIY